MAMKNAQRRYRPRPSPGIEALERRELLTLAAALDPAFGGQGTVHLAAPAGSSSGVVFTKLLPMADGQIVVSGSSAAGTLVERLDSDGSPDPTFGADGQVVLMNKYGMVASAPGGKLVVAGVVASSSGQDTTGFVLRLDADGSLDTSFGSSGELDYSLDDGPLPFDPSSEGYFEPSAVAVSADGVIAIGGLYGPMDVPLGYVETSPVFVQVTADGRLDPSFGPDGDGKAVLNDFSIFSLVDVAYAGDQIVAGANTVGTLAAPSGGVDLFRLDTDGSPDTTFGDHGMTPVTFGASATLGALTVDPQGRLLVAGIGVVFNGTEQYVARVNASGQLDVTFGTSDGGLIVQPLTDNPGDGFATTDALALQPDGRISVANQRVDGTIYLIQLTPDGALDTTQADGGFGTAPGPGPSRAGALAFDVQGRLLVLDSSEAATLDRIVFTDTPPPDTTPPVVASFAVARTKKVFVGPITLTFSEAMDPTTAGQISSYELISAGVGRVFGDKNDRVLKLASASYNAATHAVTIAVKGRVSLNQPLELVARGTTLKDVAGNQLAGAGNGVAGQDHVLMFGAKPRTIHLRSKSISAKIV